MPTLTHSLGHDWSNLFVQIAQGFGSQAERASMVAESPLSSYTVAVMIDMLLVGVLVSLLLIGGLLVVNLGMMSKRVEDRIGARDPSDVGILQHVIWPEQIEVRTLPGDEASVTKEYEPIFGSKLPLNRRQPGPQENSGGGPAPNTAA